MIWPIGVVPSDSVPFSTLVPLTQTSTWLAVPLTTRWARSVYQTPVAIVALLVAVVPETLFR
jgi:hypothetical protein